jgi:hypothetical protein
MFFYFDFIYSSSLFSADYVPKETLTLMWDARLTMSSRSPDQDQKWQRPATYGFVFYWLS